MPIDPLLMAMSINRSNSSYDLCTVGSVIEKKQVSAKGKTFCSSWNFTSNEALGGRLFDAVQKQHKSVRDGFPGNKNMND